MKYILLKFKSDWADEFDVHGFTVLTEKEYKVWCQELNEIEWPREVYFGTNEGFDFQSLEDYQENITVSLIDQNEYDVLKKLFGETYYDGIQWGNFIDPSEY